jgi:hypothetical protein
MKRPSKNNPPDYHQHKILCDNVRNPMKALFLSNTTAEESEKTLREKFGYTDKDIEKLKG